MMIRSVFFLCFVSLSMGDPSIVEAQEKVQKFMKWLKTNNADHSNVRIDVIRPDYRVLRTTRGFEAGERIYSIPDNIILRYGNIKDEPLVKALVKHAGMSPGRDDEFMMGVFIAVNKSHEHWKPWFDMFLRKPNLLHYWKSADEKPLAETFALAKHKEYIQGVKHAYGNLTAMPGVFKLLGGVKLKDFIWGVLSAKSRQFGNDLQGDGQVYTQSIVPVADFLQHGRLLNINVRSGYHTDVKEYYNQAYKSLSTGSQLVWNYGERSNGDLLVNYGFVLEELNEQNTQTNLNVGTPKGGRLCEPMTMHAGNEAAIKCIEQVFLHFDGFPGPANEKALAALKEIHKATEERMKELGPETLEEDRDRLLADKVTRTMSTNYRAALVVRVGEKEVAQWWKRLAVETALQIQKVSPFLTDRVLPSMNASRGLDKWLNVFEAELTPYNDRGKVKHFQVSIEFDTPEGKVLCEGLTTHATDKKANFCLERLRRKIPGAGKKKEIAVLKEIRRGAKQRLEDVDKVKTSEGQKDVLRFWRQLAQETLSQVRLMNPFFSYGALQKMTMVRGLDEWLDVVNVQISKASKEDDDEEEKDEL